MFFTAGPLHGVCAEAQDSGHTIHNGQEWCELVSFLLSMKSIFHLHNVHYMYCRAVYFLYTALQYPAQYPPTRCGPLDDYTILNTLLRYPPSPHTHTPVSFRDESSSISVLHGHPGPHWEANIAPCQHSSANSGTLTSGKLWGSYTLYCTSLKREFCSKQTVAQFHLCTCI